MTVSELITILGQFSPDAKVLVDARFDIANPDVKKLTDDPFLLGMVTEEESDSILIAPKR